MAKYECSIKTDFTSFIKLIEEEILEGSATASLEDSSDFQMADVQCAVRVFERYSLLGGNRLSLSLTVIGNKDSLKLSAITAGGSQAMFFKINTVGEENFLEEFRDILHEHKLEISDEVYGEL